MGEPSSFWGGERGRAYVGLVWFGLVWHEISTFALD